MKGPDLVKSSGLGAMPALETERLRPELAAYRAFPASAAPTTISPAALISSTTCGPLAFAASIGEPGVTGETGEIACAPAPKGFS